jgi:hypothetical protein
MPRKSAPAAAPPSPSAPHVIDPYGVYSLAAAIAALGLRRSTIRRELRLGHLTVSKRAGKYFILGQWLIDWIEGGVVRPQQRTGRNGVAPAGEEGGDH